MHKAAWCDRFVAGSAGCLFSLLIIAPAIQASDVIVDAAALTAQQAQIDAAANGVTVVNIVTPSAQGVSHNKYQQFNVNPQGLILNNATQLTSTQLGGYIEGNANLAYGSARIILNEVTSNLPSGLNGYTEIAGQSAEFVLANPNGITCNGCGFINTPRATLSTGVPLMSNGALSALSVNQGNIVIEGLGLNASNIPALDIYARAVTLNASLFAQQLTVIAGRQSVEYASRAFSTYASNGSTTPQFAIDASVLGGMYTNSIYLVGTEQGVGVNIASDMAASTGDITVSADGRIQLKRAVAARDLKVHNTQGDIDLTDTVYGKNVDIQTQDNLNLNADMIGAKYNLNLSAEVIEQNSIVAAGIYQNGALNDQGKLLITANTINNNSQLLGTEKVNISADTLSNNTTTSLIQSNAQLTINADTLNNQNGKIKSGQDANITVTHLNNANGELLASNELKLNIIDSIVNDTAFGTVNASQHLHLITAGNYTHVRDWIQSENLTIEANNINNNAILAAGHDLRLVARNDLMNNDVLYAGNDMDLQVGGILRNNAATIFANNNLNITGIKDSSGNIIDENDRVDNISGLIEASTGTLTLVSEELNNRRGALSVTQPIFSRTVYELYYESSNRKIEFYHHYFYEYINGSGTTASAKLFSGSNMVLDVGRLENSTSIISSAADLTITANNVYNIGRDLYEHIVTDELYTDKHDVEEDEESWHYAIARQARPYANIASTIQAQGSLQINASGGVTNITSPGPHSGSHASTVITPGVSAALPTIDDFTLPPGNLFVTQPGSDHLYLIETNPLFASYGSFISSDYMLSRLGINPEDTIKRLGDGFYETQLIRDYLLAKLGQRYIESDITSDYDQFQRLMDNALAVNGRLNLSVGVALTNEQIKVLQNDIVWMVEKTVQGEKVLVPTVYLANADARLLQRSAVISGGDIAINSVNGVTNSGQIQSRNNLLINSQDSIANIKGIMQASQDLTLKAKHNIENLSGVIKGNNVDLTATEGDIINRTVTHTEQYGDSKNGGSYTVVDETAKIQATNNLSMDAGRDIQVIGANVDAGGNAILQAGRDIAVKTIELSAVVWDRAGKERSEAASLNHVGSKMNVGGNLAMNSGNNILISGSEVDVKGNAQLAAEHDITVEAVADESSSEYHYKKKKNGKTKTVDQTESSVTHQLATLKVGGNLQAAAGNNLTLKGAEVEAGGSVALNAVNDLTIASVQDEYHYDYATKTKRPGKRNSHSESQNEITQLSSTVNAGKNITINAELDEKTGLALIKESGNVKVSGSQLQAKEGSLLVYAGDNLDIESVKNSQDYAFDQKKKRSSKSSQEKISESQTWANQSELSAGDDVLLLSGKDARIKGSNVTAGNDVVMNAGLAGTGSLTIVNDVNTDQFDYLKKSSHIGGSESSGGYASAGGRKSYKEGSYDETVVSSTIRAGNNIELSAANNIKIVSGQLSANVPLKTADNHNESSSEKSGGDILINAQTGNVDIVEAREVHTAYFETKEKRVGAGVNYQSNNGGDGGTEVGVSVGMRGGSFKSTDAADLAIGSSVDADGILQITAKNITLRGTQAHADSAMQLIAKDNLTIEHADDFHNHTEKEKILDIGTMNVQHQSLLNTRKFGDHVAENSAADMDAEGRRNLASQMHVFDNPLSKLSPVNMSLPVTNMTIDYASQWNIVKGSALSTGGDLYLKAGDGDITVTGSRMIADGQVSLNAGNRIIHQAAEQKSVTKASIEGYFGQIQAGNVNQEHIASSTTAGQELYIDAKNSVQNLGSQISALGNVVIKADNLIEQDVVGGLAHTDNTYTDGFDNLNLDVEAADIDTPVLYRSEIVSLFGNVSLASKNGDIINTGSTLWAGQDVNLTAGRDIVLRAATVQLKNDTTDFTYDGGLSLSHTRTRTDNTATEMSYLSGNNINMQAGQDIVGVHAILQADKDINGTAGRDITFTREAVQHYKDANSTNVSFDIFGLVGPVTNALNAEDDDRAQAIARILPTINSLAELVGRIEMENDYAEGALRGLQVVNTLSAINNTLQTYSSLSNFMKNGNYTFSEDGGGSGIEIRVGNAGQSDKWTESLLSSLNAGGNISFNAGRDLNLIGGTQVSAQNDISLVAGRNITVASAQDTTSSSSYDAGVTIGYNGSWYFGADYAHADSASTHYTNASINAGGHLKIQSGNDTSLIGANVHANTADLNVGNNLLIQSQQNLSDNSNGNASASTSGSGSGGHGAGSSAWVNNQTSLTTNGKLDIYVAKHTQLDAGIINSESGDLLLDTETFSYSNLEDHQKQTGSSLTISYSEDSAGNGSTSGMATYQNDGRTQTTQATIGTGTIRVRSDAANNTDSTEGLNRDITQAQVATGETEEIAQAKVDAETIKTAEAIADTVVNTLESLLASAADIDTTVRDSLGDQLALEAYKAMIAKGAEPEQINALLADPQIQAKMKELHSLASQYQDTQPVTPTNKNAETFASDSTDIASGTSASGTTIRELEEVIVTPTACNNECYSLAQQLLRASGQTASYLDQLSEAQQALALIAMSVSMGPAKAVVNTGIGFYLDKIMGKHTDSLFNQLAITATTVVDNASYAEDDKVSVDDTREYHEDLLALGEGGYLEVNGARFITEIISGQRIAKPKTHVVNQESKMVGDEHKKTAGAANAQADAEAGGSSQNDVSPEIRKEMKGGGSYLMTEKKYDRYVEGKDMVGREDGQFMTTSKEMNKIIDETGGDSNKLADKLSNNNLRNQPLIRVDVESPQTLDPRLPNSTMSGANEDFLKNGKTKGGVSEFVTDPIPAVKAWFTPVVVKE